MGGPAITLDVQCPNRRCGYEGPAELFQVAATEWFAEHFAVVCPDCARGWVVEIGGEP